MSPEWGSAVQALPSEGPSLTFTLAVVLFGGFLFVSVTVFVRVLVIGFFLKLTFRLLLLPRFPSDERADTKC